MAKEAKGLIRACPLCGNPDLKWLGGGENAIFDYIGRTSLSGQMFCEKCQERVFPIEFDSKAEYQKFLKALKSGDRGDAAIDSKEGKERQTHTAKTGLAPSTWFVKFGGWFLIIGLLCLILTLSLSLIFGGGFFIFLALLSLGVVLVGHLILYVCAVYLLVLPSNKNSLEKLVWAFFLLLPLVLESYYMLGYKFTQEERTKQQ